LNLIHKPGFLFPTHKHKPLTANRTTPFSPPSRARQLGRKTGNNILHPPIQQPQLRTVAKLKLKHATRTSVIVKKRLV
jgi:hypothetical protein